MKSYLKIRYYFYYYLLLILYFIQPLLHIIRDIAFFDDNEFCDELIGIGTGLILCYMYIVVIIPTVTLLKLNKNKPYKRYWYQEVFEKAKVYGGIRKSIIINIVAFILVQIGIVIERSLLQRTVITECAWMSITGFVLIFGVTALMSGVYLELRHNLK